MTRKLPDVAIIPCGKAKRRGTHQAADLYTGPYFRMNLAWARSVFADDRIFILSAKHGLLRLSDRIASYNLKMGERGSVAAERVASQARTLDIAGAHVCAIGGVKYLSLIKAVFPTVTCPVEGLALGHSLSALSRAIGKIPKRTARKDSIMTIGKKSAKADRRGRKAQRKRAARMAMDEIWTTREGERIAVRNMGDDHVANAIAMVVRNRSPEERRDILRHLIRTQRKPAGSALAGVSYDLEPLHRDGRGRIL